MTISLIFKSVVLYELYEWRGIVAHWRLHTMQYVMFCSVLYEWRGTVANWCTHTMQYVMCSELYEWRGTLTSSHNAVFDVLFRVVWVERYTDVLTQCSIWCFCSELYELRRTLTSSHNAVFDVSLRVVYVTLRSPYTIASLSPYREAVRSRTDFRFIEDYSSPSITLASTAVAPSL